MTARAPASADTATWARELRPAAHHLRVRVANADGTFIDLTTLCNMDFVLGATIREDIDQPVGTATVRLRRQHGQITLVPGRQSAANLDDAGDAANLLDVRREIILDAQWRPPGEPAAADGDWWEFFRGRIDTIRCSSSSDEITLECRDRGGELLDLFLWQEKVYSNTTGEPLEDVLQDLIDDGFSNYQLGGLQPWTTATVFAAGDCVRPVTRNGYLYNTAAGGTTGGTEPTWPTTLGATVVDGTVTWACASYLPTLTLPGGASGWTVRYYVQQRKPLLSAMTELAHQGGFDLRYDWDNTTQAWLLMLRLPNRTSGVDPVNVQDFGATYPDLAAGLGMQPWHEIERSIERSIAYVRNSISVLYTENDLTGARQASTAENAASIATYGRRYAELAEASTSNIDTAVEAEALRDDILQDLKEPHNRWTLTLRLFLGARLFDAWYVIADDILHDAATVSATAAGITGFEHTFDGGGAITTLRMDEGAVVGLRRTYLGREVRPGIASSSQGLSDQGNWAFRVYLQGNTSLATPLTEAQVVFDASTYDIGGTVTAGVFTVPRTGVYMLAAQATFQAVPFGQHCYMWLRCTAAGGGLRDLGTWSQQASASGTQDLPVSGTCNAWLVAGETVRMYVMHDNTDPIDLMGGSALTNLAGKRMR